MALAISLRCVTCPLILFFEFCNNCSSFTLFLSFSLTLWNLYHSMCSREERRGKKKCVIYITHEILQWKQLKPQEQGWRRASLIARFQHPRAKWWESLWPPFASFLSHQNRRSKGTNSCSLDKSDSLSFSLSLPLSLPLLCYLLTFILIAVRHKASISPLFIGF